MTFFAAHSIPAAPIFSALADRGLVVCSSCCFTSSQLARFAGHFFSIQHTSIHLLEQYAQLLTGVAMLKPIVYSFFTVILMAGLMLWGLHKCWLWFLGRCKALDTAVDRLLDFSMGGE